MRVKKQPTNWRLAEEYRTYRNNLSTQLRNTKQNYYREKLVEAEGSMKQIWQLIKEATNEKTKSNTNIERLKTSEGNVLTVSENNILASNLLNTHFVTIGSKMASQLLNKLNKTEQQVIHSNRTTTSTINSFFLSPVSEDEVSRVISCLHTNTASGPDGVSNKIIKRLKLHITKPLTHIINTSFSTATFPQAFKKSHIIPLHKGGDKTVMTNYRPISLINNFAKIVEKIVKERLVGYLEKYHLLSNNQFGFRQGMGTEDALYRLTDMIYSSLDTNKKCITVFLDLAKAFDTVSHPILLKKLDSVGVRGLSLDWFRSYLSNRKQQVLLNGVLSEDMVVQCGVPQGTVLGPILYLIYANELCDLSIKGKITAFADDTAIFFDSHSWPEVMETATQELHKVQTWLDNNLLTLNIDKTNFVAFSLTDAGRLEQTTITLHSCRLPHDLDCSCPNITQRPTVKYLGLTVDNRLRWDTHCNILVKRLRKLIYKFLTLRQILRPDLLKTIYFALVQSILSYGNMAWGGTHMTHISSLFKTQKLLLRIINFKQQQHPSQTLFTDYNVLTLRQLYLHKIVTYLHTHPQIQQHTAHSHDTRTRHTRLQVPRKKKTHSQRHMSYLAPRTYNTLPSDIRQTTNTRTFKQKLRQYLIDLGIEHTELMTTNLLHLYNRT
jgi:hypothetical protein